MLENAAFRALVYVLATMTLVITTLYTLPLL